MSNLLAYDDALTLLKKYNTDPYHIKHGQIVGGVMKFFAEKYDSENIDFWELVGLLHDIDFGLYPNEHCVKGVEILKNENVDFEIIKSAMSHGYGLTETIYKPEKQMEKILFATDELTGIIAAAALMRPSKSVSDMNLKSVKKKFKDKKFAAGCSRDVIKQGCEDLNWEINDLLEQTLEGMKTLVSTLEI